MKITVKSVIRRHGSLTITLGQDFLNGPAAHRAERILRKHMMRFQSGKGSTATFTVVDRGYNIDAISTVEGLQAAMDKWANVPVDLTFARRPTVNVFVENVRGHREMRNTAQLKAEQAKGCRVVVSHSVRLNNFPAIRWDTDQLEKVVRGGVYVDSGDWHVINMSGYLDIMDRRDDDPWDIAREWEAAARKLVL